MHVHETLYGRTFRVRELQAITFRWESPFANMYFYVRGNSIAETFDCIGVYHVRDMPTSILSNRTNRVS